MLKVLGLLTLIAPLAVAPAPRMEMPRAAHTATLLSDGRVLIVGGCNTSGCDAARNRTTEVFDPRTTRFTSGPSTITSRVGHVAVALGGGDVLVAGGWDGARPSRSAELYDASRNRFVAVGAMSAPRGGLAAARLRDGSVLIVGGTDGNRAVRRAEVYDPRTRSFSSAGLMRVARTAHTATLLRDGRVLIAGGAASDGRVLRSAEVFDPRTRTFTPTGSMTRARHKQAAVLLRDGRVLIVGGSDVRDWRGRYASAELYLPRARTFVRTRVMSAARFKLADAVVRLADGSVLVAGGAASVERYDARRARFARAGSIGTELMFSTATLLRDGRVLVAGGYDASIEPTSRTWLFAP